MRGVVLLSFALSGCMSINIQSPCQKNDIQFGWGTVVIKSCTVRSTEDGPTPPSAPTVTPD